MTVLMYSIIIILVLIVVYFVVSPGIPRYLGNSGIVRKTANSEPIRNHVLELLAHDAPLSSILEAIAVFIEQQQPEILCSIMLLDRDGRKLVTGAAPSLPDFYSRAMNELEIGLGVCSSGTTAFTGQRVIIEDIAAHPYWVSYREIAGDAGLRACWSEPVRSSMGKILGTIAIYHREIHQPSSQEIHLVEQAVRLVEIALGRHQVDQELKENQKLLNDILENVSSYIYMKDTQGRYLFANRMLRDRFEAPMEEIVGYQDSKFYDAEEAERMRKEDLQVIEKGEKLQIEEHSFNVLTGDARVFMTIKLPLFREDGSIYALCGISTDITERKDFENDLEHMAQHDALTHLPNRALFKDRLRQAMISAQRYKERLALMFIDLDRFKPVNDTYGHDVGDLLLKAVADRIQDCLRESDTAARLGGDEFVVLLPTIENQQDAILVGRKILDALNQSFNLAGHDLRISSSIGIAEFPDHGSDEIMLVKSADLAMYHAKKSGRNNVRIFEPGMQEDA